MQTSARVALIPGDGVGGKQVGFAKELLSAVSRRPLEFVNLQCGYETYKVT